jgi:hypothetical protein
MMAKVKESIPEQQIALVAQLKAELANAKAIRDFPFNGPDNSVSIGFALRLPAPAKVNARATFRFERC